MFSSKFPEKPKDRNIAASVKLPFNAYPPQQRMVKLIIEAINKRRSIVIQSPTGTGKTMCLLSSTLEAVEQKGIERVYYLTRTHTQMNGIIAEIKKTSYNPKFVIAQSKKSLCVHESAIRVGQDMGVEEFNELCKLAHSEDLAALQTVERCPLLVKMPEELQFPDYALINNQSDIKKFAKSQGFCPQRYQSALVPKAQLIIMPYIYMLNSFIFYAKKYNLQNSVIIFDQAHNILEEAKKQSSIYLNQGIFQKSIKQIDILRMLTQNQIDNQPYAADFKAKYQVINELDAYHAQLFQFTNALKKHFIKNKNKTLIMSLEEVSKVTSVKIIKFVDFRIRNKQILTQFMFDLNGIKQRNTKKNYINSLINICYKIDEMFNGNKYKDLYVCALYEEGKVGEEKFKVKFHCLSTRPVFDRLNKLNPTFIFASGTINIADFKETQLSFLNHFTPDYPSQNPYPLNNIQTFIVKQHQNKTLEINAVSLDIDPVAKYIQQVIQNIPNGILIFFKSGDYLNRFRNYIKQNMIDFNRPLFFEHPLNFQQIITNYKKQAVKPQGAILFGYMRGKASEGCNFQNSYSRAVFIVGMPFANLRCVESIIHRHINDFDTWYKDGAMKAVNQSIGRVVRHKNDYGLIFLMGRRLCEFQNKLPKWVQYNQKHTNLNIAATKSCIHKFFNSKQENTVQDKINPNSNSNFQSRMHYDKFQDYQQQGESQYDEYQQQTVSNTHSFLKHQTEKQQFENRSIKIEQNVQTKIKPLIIRPIEEDSNEDDEELIQAIKKSRYEY